MYSLMQRLADVERDGSLANRMRAKRFMLFEALTSALPRPLRILDLGGTAEFWRQRNWADRDEYQITTVNLKPERDGHPGIEQLVGDVTALDGIGDHTYDIAFSNSVIEHLHTLGAQQRMALEMQRVAPRVWCQTPNFWFPIEPHFHLPGWQWLPKGWRTFVIQHMRCGHRGPYENQAEAYRAVDEVRLMKLAELRQLFPQSHIARERFLGFTKSWVVHHGFDRIPLERTEQTRLRAAA